MHKPLHLVVFLLSLTSIGARAAAPHYRKTLHLSSSGTFQLSIFEDLHYGEAENLAWGPQQDVYSEKVMNVVLAAEPTSQLVVLNGDLITGENTFKENSSHYLDTIVRPLVAKDKLWACTYGNHDSDFNLSRSDILKREQTLYSRNSLTRMDVDVPNAGVSNYYLLVYDADDHECARTPALVLWFFDSRGGYLYQELDSSGHRVPQPSRVDESVVKWFTQTSSNLRAKYGGRVIPSLAFVHIPVSAMLAYQSAQPGVDKHREPGINDDVPLDAQKDDGPFMKALVEEEGLMVVFSAHDHGDDWCFSWNRALPGIDVQGNGLDLCFGRHSGYGGYGTWARGSRQVLIDFVHTEHKRPFGRPGDQSHLVGKSREKATPKLETWVRLETGKVSGRVTLNGTYGRDRYPAVNNTHTSLKDSPLSTKDEKKG